jgi:hypothetical protein
MAKVGMNDEGIELLLICLAGSLAGGRLSAFLSAFFRNLSALICKMQTIHIVSALCLHLSATCKHLKKNF